MAHDLATWSATVAETIRDLEAQLEELEKLRRAAFSAGRINDEVGEIDWLPDLERIGRLAQIHDEEHGNVSSRWAATQAGR